VSAASEHTFVIVGGGLAGAKAAETLREEGFDGRLVLVGAELHRPYERPPLSKGVLQGREPVDVAFVHQEGYYGEHDIELRTGAIAEALDLDERTVVLAGGERLAYDALLLAPGAEPRRLRDVPGTELDGVLVLRTIDDCEALRAAIEGAGRLLVVGAGWIGTEVAASARTLGTEVTLVDPLALPLERVLGTRMGEVFRDLHADHGVDLRLGRGLEALEGAGRVERARLADGSTVEADAVVVGIGVEPRTALAEGVLDVADGVLVDERLRASAPGVFAAGDVARAHHPFFGEALRVEHWANALHQGPVAARGMLGRDVAYDRLPYFFSDQYDLGMEYVGHPVGAEELVVRGDLAAREFVAFWTAGGRVLAGMNVNVWDVVDPIQDLIRSRAAVDPERLADPDVPLEELVPSGA
jgi:3-phenylpropionate/trans-cinnamate dioxygenase ferredoxin reductase component